MMQLFSAHHCRDGLDLARARRSRKADAARLGRPRNRSGAPAWQPS